MAEDNITETNRQMDERELGRHVRAIDKLVHELNLPADVVNQSYREILADLQKNANVKAFLPMLVSRSLKDRLSCQEENKVILLNSCECRETLPSIRNK
jgi:hypothetical protein